MPPTAVKASCGAPLLAVAGSAGRQDASGLEHACMVRTLLANEILFKAGDPRTHVYKVEAGAMCVYQPQWQGERAVIEFAFPGDYVGFGYLESHTYTARATAETRVVCLPLSEVDEIVKVDPRAEAKLAEAIERDFYVLRDSLVKAAQLKPVARVAALLVAVAHGNGQEGRDSNLIPDELTCGVVADYLSLSIEHLAAILVGLEERGLVEHCPGLGLRLKDLDALDRLANGLGPSRADWSLEARCS